MLGTGNGLGTAADESGSGRMTIFDPFSADSKFFICDGLLIGSDGVLTQQNIYQALKTSTTINNIKISPNTGTIVSGTSNAETNAIAKKASGKQKLTRLRIIRRRS
jgi:hypothetical protein